MSPLPSGITSAGEIVSIDTATDRPEQVLYLGLSVGNLFLPPDGHAAGAKGGVDAYASGTTDDGSFLTPLDLAGNHAYPAIPVGMGPEEIVMSPEHDALYVLDGGAETAGNQLGDIAPINTLTDQAEPRLLPGTQPLSMTMTPDGRTLYVMDNGSVYPIDLATNQVGPPISGVEDAYDGVVTPNGKWIYVLSWDDSVTPIDTSTNVAGRPIKIGPGITQGSGIVVTPDGQVVYALAAYDGPDVKAFGLVTPIFTSSNARGTPIEVSPDSDDLVMLPNGKNLYVPSPPKSITEIDTSTNSITALLPVPVEFGEGTVVPTPNSRTLYVESFHSNVLTVIATEGNRVESHIRLDFQPEMTMAPNGQTLYAYPSY